MHTAQLDKLHDRSREGWEAIVRYATADLSDAAKCYDVVEEIVETCTGETFWEGHGSLWSLGIKEIAERYEANRPPRVRDKAVLQESVQHWARHYQPEVKNLLTWLAAPREHPELKSAAIDFLNAHIKEHTQVVEPLADRPSLPPPSDRDLLFWLCPEYATLASLICNFIASECDRGRRLVRSCASKACGKLIVPKRVGRKLYCSPACGARAHQSQKSPEERRDYMWLYRLRQLRLPQLRRKLRQPNVVNRLAEMKRRWPQFAGMVAEIEARAKGRSAK